MSKKRIAIFTLAVIVSGGGYLARGPIRAAWQQDRQAHPTAPVAPGKGERKILYWVDPMHPAYKSDKPGTAPDCGMNLVPVYADSSEMATDLPLGTVRISAEKQQLIGVRTGKAEVRMMDRTIRAVGKIEADETKIAHIHTKFTGWIEKVFVDYVGKLVRKGQPLFTIYSPDLVSTQQEYLIALKARRYLSEAPFAEVADSTATLLEATRQRLKNWGISEEQIRALEESGHPSHTITMYSPIDGFVTMRTAFGHTYITPEKEIYTIVDLSTVWATAEVYEYEVSQVRVGQPARMRLTYEPGRIYEGEVTYVYPTVDPQTRTVKVRVELANPYFELKPEMYATVEIDTTMGRQLVVPQEAVLDAGTKQYVFVAKGDGYFEPRAVRLGGSANGYAIVLSGLAPGDELVTSGNFLIDSESRLKSALGTMTGMGHGAAPAEGGQKTSAQRPTQTEN